MLLVIATVVVDPGDADAAREALTELTLASRDDRGCRSYEFLESTDAPGTFRSLETWDSQEDLDAHLEQPHVASAIETVTPFMVGELTIDRYDATLLEG